MTPLQLFPDMATTGPWTDVEPCIGQGKLERIGLLRNGTSEGRAAVGLLIRLDDGSTVIAQTTWRVFHAGVRAPVASEEPLD